MSRTIAIPPPEQDVLGLGAAATMAFVLRQREAQDAAAAEEMRAVTHWADLHRVDHVGAVPRELERSLTREVGLLAMDVAAGVEGELRLAGEGAFRVAEFAVAELAAALGLSEPGARAYVGQAVELRDRLPRCWARVMAGDLPAWKGRKIAEQTIPLNAAAATYVDQQLAPFAHRISLPRILTAVEAACLRHDPELAAERAARAGEKRGVWVEDRVDGTSAINAITNTTDAHAFDAALDQVATTLGELGDADPRDVRRAKAIGVLADPQYALELVAPAALDAAGGATGAADRRVALHLHLHVDAVRGPVAEGAGTGHVARVDGLGPRALETVEQWLRDLAPGTTVTVTPVVDLTEHISVDAYEIPDRLRRQVAERDDCCRFPWCGRRGRFDVDHIVPFVPRQSGGPPGQTSSSNTTRLCRFHHRLKTHGGWDYRRDPDGALTWTSPLGRTYLVDETGTRPRS